MEQPVTTHLIILLFVVGFSVFARGAFSAKGVSVTPGMQKISIGQNDQEKEVEIVVVNDTDRKQMIRFSVLDFGQNNETGAVFFGGREGTDLERDYGLAGWLDPPRDAVLSPGEKRSFTGKIINRSSLNPGGHYGAIIGKVEGEQKEDSGNMKPVAVEYAFASLLFVSKEGGERFGLDLTDWKKEKTWSGMPTNVSLRIINTGNVHVAPRGMVEIYGLDKKLYGKGIINEGGAEMLPGRARVFPITIKPVNNPILPGLYTLKISYRYQGSEKYSVREESFVFYGIPFLSSLGIIICLIILSVYWYKIHRKKSGL